MNRGIACLLLSVILAVGCGARTGTSGLGPGGRDDSGGSVGAASGEPNLAGTPTFGGAPSFAGAPTTGGVSGFAGGTPATGGAPSFAGAPTAGGFPSFGGAPAIGGAPSFAGAPTAGGFPSFGGAAGSGGEGGVIVNTCVAIANNDCDKCLCSACSSQVVSCVSNSQCTNIFSCVVRTGCLGPGCYARNTCKRTIDDNGGPFGPAVSEVVTLVTCAAQSQGNCGCN